MTLAEFERSRSSSGGLLNDSYDCYRFRKTIGGYELFFAAEPNKGKGMTIVNAAATRKSNCKGCGANYYDTCQWVGRSIRRCSECPGGLFAEVE